MPLSGNASDATEWRSVDAAGEVGVPEPNIRNNEGTMKAPPPLPARPRVAAAGGPAATTPSGANPRGDPLVTRVIWPAARAIEVRASC